MENGIKVLIVGGHRTYTANTTALLSSVPGILPLQLAEDEEASLKLVQQLNPEVILLDIRLPGKTGLALAEQIRAESPETKIIVLLESKQQGYVRKSVQLGVQGILMKDCPLQEMSEAIFRVQAGGVYFSPSPLTLPQFQNDFNDLHFPVKPVNVLKKILTPEEQEWMNLLAKGLSDREIAAIYGLSTRTVHERVGIILLKFGVGTRLEAVLSWVYVDS